MVCATCDQKHYESGYFHQQEISYPPFNAGDIWVYDGAERRKLTPSEWNNGKNKVLIFYPEVFTPVCATEMGALKDWVGKFAELNTEIYSFTTDPISAVEDWYNSNDLLEGLNYKAASSFMLPYRLGIMNGSRAKRATVYMMANGDMIIQEHFMKVGRSIKEIHRNIFAYNTGSYCAEGWQGEEDGFIS